MVPEIEVEIDDLVESWFRPLVAAGDTRAMVCVGDYLAAIGKPLEQVKEWYQEAATAGDLQAIMRLVALPEAREKDRQTWLNEIRKAAAAGRVDAMWQLALTTLEVDEAERWLRSAAERGYDPAVARLGEVLLERGYVEDAEQWCRQAADAGNRPAMIDLGQVLILLGKTKEAERWLRTVAETTGSDEAIDSLADLLARSGRHEEAEEWRALTSEAVRRLLGHGAEDLTDTDLQVLRHWRAYDAGRRGAFELARSLEEGRLEEAESWYRQAAELGSSSAVASLGRMLILLGRTEEAESWLRTGAEAGSYEAAELLAELLEQRGSHDSEATWRERVPTEAMWRLALRARGREGEEEWLRLAAERGHDEAAERLSSLLLEQQRLEDAERWCRQAAETGRSSATVGLARVLVLLGRTDEAEPQLRTAADEGSHEAMDLLADLLERRDECDQAEVWRQQAEETRAWRGPVLRQGGALLIVATVVIATAVVPFVKKLVERAAEDSYDGARAWLRRLFARRGYPDPRPPAGRDNQLLIVEEPGHHLNLALHLWTDTPDEAISALEGLDLDSLSDHSRPSKPKSGRQRRSPPPTIRIYWNQATGSWQRLDE